MNRRGGPFRFLALVIGGWGGLRLLMLAPSAAPIAAPAGMGLWAGPSPGTEMRPAAGARAQGPTDPSLPIWRGQAARLLHGQPRRDPGRPPEADPSRVALALLGMVRIGVMPAGDAGDDPVSVALTPAIASRKLPIAIVAPDSGRWSASFWLVARRGQGLGASPSGGQLGGSQAGARLAFALDDRARLALFGRIASPLGGPGQEAAIGIEWRPTPLPVRLVAEHRIGINGAAGGPSVAIIGGIGPRPLPGDFHLEAYGQAGIIARWRLVGYAEGAARVTHRLGGVGRADIDLGAGAWGGIQPGAARLDVGPSLGAAVPIGGQQVRLTLDWRARVAGRAAPGSGPALSIGADF